jgi:hypothetical protein
MCTRDEELLGPAPPSGCRRLAGSRVVGRAKPGLGNVKDIRQVSQDEYWEGLRHRWGALLSYRYIGRAFSSMNSSTTDESVVLRHDMRNAAGGVMAAPLAIACPSPGSRSDLEVVPNPVILSLQILDDARDVKRIEVIDSQALKSGSRMDFGRATIVDADNHRRAIAFVESQSAAIGAVPAGLSKFDDDPTMAVEDSPELPPLWQVFGGSLRDDGHWVLPELRAEFSSPDAALHLGPQHVILEQAAFDLAVSLAGTSMLQIESWHVMFLARGKKGPFRVDGEAWAEAAGCGRLGVKATLCDEGYEGRMTTSATAVFRNLEMTERPGSKP